MMAEASTATLTVYDVLAARARSRSSRFLASQAALSAVAAATVLGIAVSWWPLAALLAALSAYSAWGLADASERRHSTGAWRAAKRAAAVVATVATLLAAVGVALAAFAGNAPGPYGTCHADGRYFPCDADGRRR